MRNVKRRAVAITTVIAIAFVMVASMIPAIMAKADEYKEITDVSLEFEVPEAGTVVSFLDSKKFKQSTLPVVIPSTDGIRNYDNGRDRSPDGVFIRDFSTIEEYNEVGSRGIRDEYMFFGTFESGKTYKAIITVAANIDNGYYLSDEANISIKNATILDYEIDNCYDEDEDEWYWSMATLLISFTIPEASSDVTTITSGSTVSLNQADDGTVSFRLDKPLSYFENGGELYIDNNLVPREQYTYREGSTIITLGKELASKLTDGVEHAVKVVFNDGETLEAKLIVKAALAEASTATSSTATATTVKATAPKTDDSLPYVGLVLVFVGTAAIGVIAYRRKNS